MTALTQAQTREIISRHRVAEKRAVVRRLLRQPPRAQQTILRDYLKKPIWDVQEIAYRDALDGLLGLMSALQVVTVATGSLPHLPKAIKAEFREILANPAVRNYYETLYPTALPVLFRHELAASDGDGPWPIQAEADAKPEDGSPLGFLISFFELDGRIMRGVQLSFFLDLLDHYIFDDVSIDTILEIVGNPKEYEKLVLKSDKRKRAGHSGSQLERRGVQGLEDFIRFCADLHRLLERLTARPHLRAAVWLHYCYWFGNGSQGVRSTAAALRHQLAKWAAQGTAETSQIIADDTERVTSVLTALTDWEKYAGPLVRDARPRLDHWASHQVGKDGASENRTSSKKSATSRSTRQGRRRRRLTEEEEEE